MSEFFNEPYGFENMHVLKLAEELERAAANYDKDYRDGLSDCFSIKKCSVDAGANLENQIELSIVKTWEYSSDGRVDAKVSYSVTAELMHFNLTPESFPADMWKQIKDEELIEEGDGESEDVYDDDWLDTLDDDETDFAVGYRYAHTINSDGQLFPESCIVVYVNGRELAFPEHRISPNAHYAVPEADMTSSQLPPELESIFTSAEFEEIKSIGATVLAEQRPAKIIEDLYTQIDSLRYRTTEMRVEAMRRIVSNLLPELQLSKGRDD